MPKLALKALAATAFSAFLAGCAQPAPYAPRQAGEQTGYTDQQLAQNRWRVTFTGNAVTPRALVEDDLLRRAAEVTLAAGYSHFLFDSRDTQTRTDIAAFRQPGPNSGNWTRSLRGFIPNPAFGYDPFVPEMNIVTTTSFQAYAEIVVLTPDQAAHEPRAVEANSVIQHLARPQPQTGQPA